MQQDIVAQVVDERQRQQDLLGDVHHYRLRQCVRDGVLATEQMSKGAWLGTRATTTTRTRCDTCATCFAAVVASRTACNDAATPAAGWSTVCSKAICGHGNGVTHPLVQVLPARVPESQLVVGHTAVVRGLHHAQRFSDTAGCLLGAARGRAGVGGEGGDGEFEIVRVAACPHASLTCAPSP